MSRVSHLEAVSLFAGLPEEDLARLAEGVDEIEIPAGSVLFTEGEEGNTAYVVTSGDIEIVKQDLNREVLLAVQGPGTVIGEMALLRRAPRMATGRARTDMRLLAIPKTTLDYVLDTSPAAARIMMDTVLERWRDNQAQLRQSERMAQLGTLTAGLAHELNNPAAAVKRGAGSLSDAVAAHGAAYAEAVAALPDPGHRDSLESLLDQVMTLAGRPADLDPLARSDREGEMEDWLMDRSIPRAWDVAPALVELGFDTGDLDRMAGEFPDEAIGPVIAAVHAAQDVGSLVREVEEGAERLSAIVKALKSYSYLDQAPVQTVDVRTGLDDTLLILKRKIGDITVRRDYDPDLPTIEAYGSELNQVWTNLIDNAADAIAGDGGPDDGLIQIRAFPVDDGGIAVEVEDNGPGIPENVQSRIFDSFFTTKPPGSGTGLGLDISRSIVMMRHGGSIDVRSQPGTTVFRVELPAEPPA